MMLYLNALLCQMWSYVEAQVGPKSSESMIGYLEAYIVILSVDTWLMILMCLIINSSEKRKVIIGIIYSIYNEGSKKNSM